MCTIRISEHLVRETNKRDESVAERGNVDGTRPFSGSASGDGARWKRFGFAQDSGGEEGSDVDESMGKQTTDLAGFLCRVG